MADTVVDKLWNIPPGLAWQNNADTSDTNRPQPGDLVRPGTETSIDGNIRRIKSDMRQFTLDPVWVNYLGLTTAPSQGPPTRLSDVIITLDSNWQNVAVLGRMIRATTFAGGDPNQPVKSASPIMFASYDGGTNLTTITVRDPIFGAGTGGNWVAGQSYVEFSAIDPSEAGAAGSTHSATVLVPVPFPIGSPNPTTFVLPVELGGTGNNVGAATGVAGPAGGDLSGTFPDPTVAKIQGETLDLPVLAPAARTKADLLGWDPSTQAWQPRDAAEALSNSPPATIQSAIAVALRTRIDNPTDGGQGWLILPTYASSGPGGFAQNVDFYVQWATLVIAGDPGSGPHIGVAVPFQIAFPTKCVFAQAAIYVNDANVGAFATVKSADVMQALVNYAIPNVQFSPTQVTLRVLAIGY